MAFGKIGEALQRWNEGRPQRQERRRINQQQRAQYLRERAQQNNSGFTISWGRQSPGDDGFTHPRS